MQQKPSKSAFLKRECGNTLEYRGRGYKGDGAVESLLLQDHVTGEKKEISLQGVFIAVGIQPETAAFEGVVDMEQGYIKAGEAGITSVPGIYAAGDVRTKNCGRSLQQRQTVPMQ